MSSSNGIRSCKITIFPPNTTCGTQPLDAGIIKHFKMKYRQLLMNYLIASSETAPSIQENIKMVTLKQSTNWITSAWNNVESTVIQNCFKHVGINICPVEEISLENEIRHFIDSANYLSIDCPEIINEDIQVHDHVDIENLDSTILNPLHEELVDQEEMENSNLKSGPSISTALKSIKILLDYATFNNLDSDMEVIIKLENTLVTKRLETLKQTGLDKYFNKN